jgi:PAS domain S-box-containing protein/putative nucleotidyltransferase with HDIG domain
MNKILRHLSRSEPDIAKNSRWPRALAERNASNGNLEKKIRERTAALLASEEKYRLLLENANEAILVLQEGAIRFSNPMATHIWGYTSKELTSLAFLELLAGSDRQAWKAHIKRIALEPTDTTACFQSLTKEGLTRWIEVRATHISWEGRPATLTLVTDVTERKQTEEILRVLSARNEAILAAVPDIIMEVDARRVYVWANSAGRRFFGEDVLGKEAAAYYEGDQDTTSRIQPLFEGDNNIVYVESWQRRRDGQKRLLAWWCKVLKDDKGVVTGALSTARDITEQKLAEDELRHNYEKLQRAMDGAVKALALLAERRDPYTAGHQQRVARLAVGIAQELGLPPEEVETLAVAGLLHDIGKVSVPTEILSKPSKLNESEFNLLRGHSRVGYDIVKTLGLPWAIDQIVLQHHERLDGSGYPHGLAGDDIILGAKILGVADVVEAMVSHRPYRAALGLDKALEEISEKKGVLYDPAVVEACLELFKEKGFSLEEDRPAATIE